MIVCVCALAIFGQQQQAQNLQNPDTSSTDAFFRYFGYISVSISAMALAVAAIYGSWKKQALNEAIQLAATRKERNDELRIELARIQLESSKWQNLAEDLEKKNLRLQDEKR